MASNLQDFEASLLRAYGSLDEPNYSKIVQSLKERIYQPVVDRMLADGITIKDVGDENDDVAAMLFATRDGTDVAVELSAVGPYANVREFDLKDRSLWVTRPDNAQTPLGKTIARIVTEYGYQLLDRETALHTVAMNRWDGSTEATLYQALFTDTDHVP